MAKRICRTADRFDPTGVPRPRCCVRRATPPSCTAVIHEISQRDKDAFIFGAGCAGLARRQTGRDHSLPPGPGRAAPPICSDLIYDRHRCRYSTCRGSLRDQVLRRRLTLGVVIFDLSTILLSRSPARSICCRIAWRAACSSLAWIAAAIAKCSSSVAAFVRSSWKVCGYHTPTRLWIVLERLTYRGLSVAAAIVS